MTYLLFIPFIAAGVIGLLRLLFGVCVRRHIVAICVGMVVGFVLGFDLMFAGAGGNETVKHIFDFLNAPSSWTLSFLPAAAWGLFHFTYWALLGSLLSFGIARVAAKLTGETGKGQS